MLDYRLPTLLGVNLPRISLSLALNSAPYQGIYCFHTVYPGDLFAFFRRTGIGTLGNPGDSIVEEAGELAAKELGWDRDRLVKELEEANRALNLPE